MSSPGDPDTRVRILQAAWRLIEESGVNPRLVDIAERAGVSRQALYLHFGDRAGLLFALVQYIDQSLGKADLLQRIVEAPSGVESLDRMVEALSIYSAKVDNVVRVLEAAQYQDDAIAAAWRNRMTSRRTQVRAIMQRIADDGCLAEGWSVETATDLCYTVIMPGPWRELVHEIGWTPKQYAERMKRVLHRSFVVE